MKINIQRNTGIVGMGTKITLKSNGKLVTHLKNNQQYQIENNEEPVQLTANQWYLGSTPVTVQAGQTVEIVTNPTALLLFFISIVTVFLGSLITPVFSVVGLLLLIGTMIFSLKNWFRLNVN
ncbi:hypothetical protein ACYSNR_11800 [Enterococcus sp. LJL128]|uniref:hypothetical protein n=1 Tax=Enterococcus sp. LJL51 TaxID=3416656 RepID=UPI003CF785FE